MRAVLIVAHPDPGSFTHTVARRVQHGLEAAGHDVALHDLYAEGFRAAMTAEERHAYHGDHPVVDPLVDEHIAHITQAHTLIYVYPTWWSGLPAILKGWFERVMVPGVGFVFDHRGKVRPGLTNVRRLVGISTYGSPKASVRLVNDNGRRTVMRAMRLSTGWRTRSRWLGLYGIDSSTPAERAEFLERCERLARSL
jgi:putative NADPH-quinone reductase